MEHVPYFRLWHMQDYVTQTLNGIDSTLKYNSLSTKKNRFVLHNIAAIQHTIKPYSVNF